MIKIFISYFYQIRFFTTNTIPLSTALWDPRWYHEFQDQSHTFYDKNGVINGLRVPMLAPGDSCKNLCEGVSKCKVQTPSYCKFMENYREQLNQIDFNNFMLALEAVGNNMKQQAQFDGDPIIVLIVHESPDNPCSERTALQAWFRDNGYILEEWKPNKSVRVGIQTVPFVPLCPECNNRMEIAWFLEDEYRVTDGIRHPTGRHRMNANYLECPECLHKEPVDDDTFAKPWEK